MARLKEFRCSLTGEKKPAIPNAHNNASTTLKRCLCDASVKKNVELSRLSLRGTRCIFRVQYSAYGATDTVYASV